MMGDAETNVSRQYGCLVGRSWRLAAFSQQVQACCLSTSVSSAHSVPCSCSLSKTIRGANMAAGCCFEAGCTGIRAQLLNVLCVNPKHCRRALDMLSSAPTTTICRLQNYAPRPAKGVLMGRATSGGASAPRCVLPWY